MKIGLLSIFTLLSLTMFAQEDITRDTDGCQIFEMAEGDTVYVMKQYYMVFLKKGNSRNQDREDEAKIQAGHMAHLNKMDEDGYLSIAGPFGHDGDLRGILIFNVPTEEKVRELIEGDPAFKAGRLSYELYPWWGAKGSKLK